jgi:HD-GYP domain-containing protein (c-di-GMP phosphodiesterase class II)
VRRKTGEREEQKEKDRNEAKKECRRKEKGKYDKECELY